MMPLERFFDLLLANVKDFAEASWREHRDAAVQDSQAFVQAARADLERWVVLLADGALTPDDFDWLVRGKKDLAELEALKQAGLAKARLDGFRNSLIDVVIGTALDVI